ncbi:MAG: molybdopterin molybdotransferase MoeA [Methylocystaceae bacterium]
MEREVSIERAHELIASRVVRIADEEISISTAAGRTLSRDLYCQQNMPAWPQSAVDGWALAQGGEIGSRYQISQDKVLHRNQAYRVLTGGILPEGTAAVVPEEKTDLKGDLISLQERVKSGSNIKQVGEDFELGELLLSAYTPLDWGTIALLAAAGVHPIPVVKRPRVAVMAMAANLVPYAAVPQPGFTRDCNTPLLTNLVSEEGGMVIEEVQDNCPERLRELAKKADIVLITGGTYNQNSADAWNLMLAIGAEILYWGVNIQPGSHHGCGVYNGCLLLALSGNPGACAVGYHLFAAPALRLLQGISPWPPAVKARCVNNFPKPANTRRLVRGQAWTTGRGWEVFILPGQKPSMIRSLLHCNALIDLPAGSSPLNVGDMVSIILLDRNQTLLPAEQDEFKVCRVK